MEQRRIQADRLKENPFYTPIKAPQADNNKQGHDGLEIADFLVFLTVFSLRCATPDTSAYSLNNLLTDTTA